MTMVGGVRRRASLVAGVFVIAALAVFAPVVLAADTTISISTFAFPATTTVSVGDTVTWHNTSGATHTATADGGSFATGSIADGASKSVTFSTAGSFAYHCSIHSSMTGTIIVQAAGATAPATDTDPASSTPESHDTTATILALLGVAMLLGTLVSERRFARVPVRPSDEQR
jgi:plastocyanin